VEHQATLHRKEEEFKRPVATETSRLVG